MAYLKKSLKRFKNRLQSEHGQGVIQTIGILIGVIILISGTVYGVTQVFSPGTVNAPLQEQVQHWDNRTDPGSANWDENEIPVYTIPDGDEEPEDVADCLTSDCVQELNSEDIENPSEDEGQQEPDDELTPGEEENGNFKFPWLAALLVILDILLFILHALEAFAKLLPWLAAFLGVFLLIKGIINLRNATNPLEQLIAWLDISGSICSLVALVAFSAGGPTNPIGILLISTGIALGLATISLDIVMGAYESNTNIVN